MRSLVWFRGKDLRTADHPALCRAASRGRVLCLFVLEPKYFEDHGPARCPHRIQFLLESLKSLEANLAHLGSELLFARGPSRRAVPALASRWQVDEVHAMRDSAPGGRTRDHAVSRALSMPLVLHEGETLLPPGSLRTGSDTPYAVFTPFARSAREVLTPPQPLPVPKSLSPVPKNLDRADLVERPSLELLGLERNPGLQAGGERQAHARLNHFIKDAGARYATCRDRMDRDGTSRLSADLKFGTLSIGTVYARAAKQLPPGESRDRFLTELLWREFAYHTLFDRPELLHAPFREDFEGFPWRDPDETWTAWQEGRTGYPVVDAAARQLLGEGFVHNRARMISASFLCKHLLLPYTLGEAHYLHYLTDGDPPQNNLGWQWSAGCGCDAQPYFRVFNPVTQGRKFDPTGAYVRRWVPELSALPDKHIHSPWQAPEAVLKHAGVRLDEDYPSPCVDHAMARERFLSVARAHLTAQQR